MPPNIFASRRKTMGPAAPQPRMPTKIACSGETASQTNPARHRAPLKIITRRSAALSVFPPKIGAASSIDIPKNQSQTKLSRTNAGAGHLHGRNSARHDSENRLGWLLTISSKKLIQEVTATQAIMKARAARLYGLWFGDA